MKKKIFILNALILTFSSFFLRFMNIGFRIWLSEKIGAEGIGLYQLIFSVFMTTVTVSTSGISLAVTRITSETIGNNHTGRVRSAICKCALCALTVSLVAGGALFFLADPIAETLLFDSRAALCLRLLTPGLPFMALCACFKGYFLAVRRTIHSACGELLEQIATVGGTVVLFLLFSPGGLESALLFVMLGSTAGELASFLYTFLLYRICLKKEKKEKSTGVFQSILHIALPGSAGSAVKASLAAAENLLIPFGLKKNGSSAQNAMAQYGTLQGMSLPMLFFPSSLLVAFSSLLIPEISEACARKDQNCVFRATSRALKLTLVFSIFAACIFFAFADDLGMTFYKSEQAGSFLRILAPLVPLMYLDTVVDGILKGLDQQLYSLRYNFLDSSIRVVLIWFLLPLFGLKSYLCILFFSTIFNASLSLHRLLKVSRVELRFFSWILVPFFFSVFSVFLFSIFPLPIVCKIAFSSLLYFSLLFLCNILSFSEFRRLISFKKT